MRAQGGDAATVNQPLPLPEGVSDLAVGEGGQSYGAQFMPCAPAYERSGNFYGGGVLKARKAPTGERQESYDLALGQRNTPPPVAASPSFTITIDTVAVKGRLAEASVRKYVQEHKSELLHCLREAGNMPRGKILINWTIDADGTVKDIRISPDGGRRLSACLIAQIGKWRFSTPEDGKKVYVRTQVSVAQ